MYARETPDGTLQRHAKKDLEAWWPESRCINTFSLGAAISRMPRQLARRTASLQHYEVAWSPPRHRLMMDGTVMWDLIRYNDYPDLNAALKMLEDGTPSVAINEHIILWQPKRKGDPINVNWHDQYAGTLQDGLYVPDDEGSCFAKLTRYALQEGYEQCL